MKRIPWAAKRLRAASTTSTTGPQVRLVQNFDARDAAEGRLRVARDADRLEPRVDVSERPPVLRARHPDPRPRPVHRLRRAVDHQERKADEAGNELRSACGDADVRARAL